MMSAEVSGAPAQVQAELRARARLCSLHQRVSSDLLPPSGFQGPVCASHGSLESMTQRCFRADLFPSLCWALANIKMSCHLLRGPRAGRRPRSTRGGREASLLLRCGQFKHGLRSSSCGFCWSHRSPRRFQKGPVQVSARAASSAPL